VLDGGKTQAKPEVAETREETADGPLMDSQTQAVKKMLARSKERGYVTYDELNAVLPPEQMSSEQIEDTLAMLSEIGINVVESEESEEPAPAAKKPKEDEEEAEEARPPATSTTTMSAAPTIRCACICARWAPSNCCRAKARSPSPSASRPAAT
jgi:hypothetical protein